MNKKQKEILSKLKGYSLRLKHSVKKREIPYAFYKECLNHFGSFNNSKEKAGLTIRNKRILKLPQNLFKRDNDLVKIMSYLTFDGHIYKDLSGFYFSSKNIKDLNNFEKLIKRKFKFKGKYYLNNGGAGKTKTHKFIIFNKYLSKKLNELGVPAGSKVLQKFIIPRWIIKSKNFSIEYLKIAFFCEGSMKESRKNPRIHMTLAKIEENLESGIDFMNTLKKMLEILGICTTPCYVTGNRVRKTDNKVSKDLRFKILTKYNNIFIKKIGWLK